MEPNIFVGIFKQRLIDEFTQKWISNTANNSVLDLYRYVKTEFGYANYLDHVRNKSLRHEITKIRVSSHTLRIQTGRYGRNRLERNERLCMYCDNRLIDDEYHFICECPKLDYIRAKYIKDYYRTRPNTYKLCKLLSTQNKVDIINLGKFFKEAFQLRKLIDGLSNILHKEDIYIVYIYICNVSYFHSHITLFICYIDEKLYCLSRNKSFFIFFFFL